MLCNIRRDKKNNNVPRSTNVRYRYKHYKNKHFIFSQQQICLYCCIQHEKNDEDTAHLNETTQKK